MTDRDTEAAGLRPAERVVLVSIDGLAPRSIGWATMPCLCGLALHGASTWSAAAVSPPLPLPAHASMLRGVAPGRHGITTNGTPPVPDSPASFLHAAGRAGRSTAVVASWQPLMELVGDAAVTHRSIVDAGYGATGDEITVQNAVDLLTRHGPDVSFVHLTGPDLAGHSDGWASDGYLQAVAAADRHLARLLDTLDPDTSVIVTTDHGGEGHDHAESTPAIMTTFMVVRSPRVAPRSIIHDSTILDVAPTVADLCGATNDPKWSGSSVLGRCEPIEEWLLALVDTLSEHDYGERVDMLSHSLQTAVALRADGASDALVLAGLFHDIGHLLGPATTWGLPDHADVGARFLQRWFGPAVTEPIRLHVAAKRYLTATDPAYTNELSAASVATLAQQGGPFTPAEAAEFEDHPMATDAVRLRRADDAGKTPGVASVDLEGFRKLIGSAIDAMEVGVGHRGRPVELSPAWVRDSCECTECRHPGNDQHLIDASDLAGWTVVTTCSTESGSVVDVRHRDGRTHRCTIAWPRSQHRCTTQTTWRADHVDNIRPGAQNTVDFARRLATFGISLLEQQGTAPGTVLAVANEVGFVRNTNYGELFDVIAEESPTNLAFTNVGLPLHTDNPYRDPVPTVQLLHCLHSADAGGGSIFADGFSAAQQLHALDPVAFDLLSTTPVRFEFVDDSVLLTAEVPLIRLGVRGNVDRVTINNRSMRAVDIGVRTTDFYDAYVAFSELLAHDDNTISLDLAPGEVIGFDNRRVLHGRSGFATGGARHLQGCYIDIDAINSTAMRSTGGFEK